MGFLIVICVSMVFFKRYCMNLDKENFIVSNVEKGTSILEVKEYELPSINILGKKS